MMVHIVSSEVMARTQALKQRKHFLSLRGKTPASGVQNFPQAPL